MAAMRQPQEIPLESRLRGRHLELVMVGAGWKPKELALLLGYGSLTSIYRLLDGKQELTGEQAERVAREAVKMPGVWRGMEWQRVMGFLVSVETTLAFMERLAGDDEASPSSKGTETTTLRFSQPPIHLHERVPSDVLQGVVARDKRAA